MTKQKVGAEQAPAAQPALTEEVAEMVTQAQAQGISLKEYIRRTAQSTIATEANKVRDELSQQAGAVVERQQAIVTAGEEYDTMIAGLVEQGVDISGKDLVSERNKHIAARVPVAAPPEEKPPVEQVPLENPMMAAANTLLKEVGLLATDPEFEAIRTKWSAGEYPGWNDFYADIRVQADAKKTRLKAPATTKPPGEVGDEFLKGNVVPGEVGGGQGGAPEDNPIENINDPDQLLEKVDWENLNLPKG